MIKAEWTNKDSLDLQPTCNQLATTEGDLISRQDAINAVCANCLRQDLEVLDGCLGEDCSIKPILESLPSADISKGKEVARMSDLIRRQDAIDRIQGTGYAEQIKNNLLFIIWALPSADRPQGEWLERNSAFYKWIRCSVCNKKSPAGFIKTNFCPNCGADMRGEE